MSDSPEYLQKKAFFDNLLTIYGRKPVLEALENSEVPVYRLHLADSNKPTGIIDTLIKAAEKRGVDIQWHDRKALSRISKNAKQDQGVCADLNLQTYIGLEQFLAAHGDKPFRLVALDGITNPQNLGMIIRSVCAGNVDGLLLPKSGCAALSPLVIKASAGTLFKATLLRCDSMHNALQRLKPLATVCTLSSAATTSLFEFQEQGSVVYVLGNETDGVSPEVEKLSDQRLVIPMNNGVESLNVAVTAALVAFR